MKITSIQIYGYRSFAPRNDAKSYFTFESNIVALIGKNGVGKTNALEAISRLKFFTDDVVNVIPPSAVNQNTGGTPDLTVHAELDDADIAELGSSLAAPIKDRHTGCVWRYKPEKRITTLDYFGAFFDIMQTHPSMLAIKQEVRELADYLEKEVKIGTREYRDLVSALSDYDRLYVPRLRAIVAWGVQNLPGRVNAQWKDRVVPLLERFADSTCEKYEAFARISPHVCKFEDTAEFPDSYRLDDIVALDRGGRMPHNDRVALDRLLDAIGSSRQKIIEAFEEQNAQANTGLRGTIRNAVRKLSRDFNKWYMNGTAGVELDVGFDGRVLKLDVNNADMPGSVMWSDANAGMRWYFSAFLELQRALKFRNVIILVDEPANHLHVNAQREALTLLQNLARDGRYVVYTTHSPYMLDKDRLGDVRAVVREGSASAIRTITAVEDVDCRHEALTPVFHAIGCSMSAGLTPDATRRNALVEGITDYLYLNAMQDAFGVEPSERLNIIPCQGAPSLPYVVPLFIGWGLPFSVLVDGDDAGKDAYDRIHKAYGPEIGVLFLGGKMGRQIEDFLSENDYRLVCGDKLDPDRGKAKSAKARRFASMVKSGDLVPDTETRRKFAWLLDQLFRCADPIDFWDVYVPEEVEDEVVQGDEI